ncbi:MAG TPA: cupin domain-containing protein [Nitrososphaera sp.]|nr:cupin domain-containing protein [Nitrososphaera sp.]
MKSTATPKLAKRLRLEKHKEGGYFKETYRSETTIDIEGYEGRRNIATAIYYMLARNDFSAFHRIKSDEIWHHYAGGTVTLYAIDKDGRLSKTRMGKNGAFQVVIKAGTWFAAALESKRSYCLLGCTVSPGFDYRDWEIGKRDDLVRMYPQHRKIIERYTK